MEDKNNLTMKFNLDKEKEKEAKDIIIEVYEALEEKGYNPINQFIGYILSGDPTYITNYNNARSIIRKIERDELLEELLRTYLEKNCSKETN
ncbi:MAG: IreB family regulatory phosphoprotein [Clostridiales bacterium]|nr:IreB family regulatory phosphoprotein [Clostridiales bacterium]